jgi:hypothetical protein
MPKLLAIGHGTKLTLEGFPWPYDVWISFENPGFPLALGEGVGHGAAGSVLSAEDILSPSWREHLTICNCEWLIDVIRLAMADGIKVTPELLEAAWRARKFQTGFRLSMLDIVIVVAGAVASGFTMTVDRWFGIAISFVVLHFFLFCNVLRMSRPLELIWAGIFASLAGATIALNFLSWPIVFVILSVVTIIVAIVEMRRPSYHGVAWQKLNPRLPEWWQSAIGGITTPSNGSS